MRIVVSPDPLLRQKCKPIDASELKGIFSIAMEMAEIMYQNNGCGIAAPQVGISKRLVVIDCSIREEGEEAHQDPTVYINPEILERSGEETLEDEGCLSIPGISIPIKRLSEITVQALDLNGDPFSHHADGLLARALQHEIDHLDGITMFDHLDPIARIEALKSYEEALREGARPGDTGVRSQPNDQEM